MSTTDQHRHADRHKAIRLDRYLANPVMRPLIRWGCFPRAYALLETTGRTSGLARVVPVGQLRDGDSVWVVAEHGRHAAYVRNLLADPRVRVRLGRRWHDGTARVVPDDDALARRRLIDARRGVLGRLDGLVFRSKATEPLTIEIALDRPT